MLDFLIFSIIFIGLNVLVDSIFALLKIGDIGLDFLFFAPWIVGTIYGIYEGIILAIILTVIHMLFNLDIGHWILTAMPAQVLAVFIGNSLGMSGFWLALVSYFAVTTAILAFLKHISSRYMVIVLINSIFSVILLYVIPTVGLV